MKLFHPSQHAIALQRPRFPRAWNATKYAFYTIVVIPVVIAVATSNAFAQGKDSAMASFRLPKPLLSLMNMAGRKSPWNAIGAPQVLFYSVHKSEGTNLWGGMFWYGVTPTIAVDFDYSVLAKDSERTRSVGSTVRMAGKALEGSVMGGLRFCNSTVSSTLASTAAIDASVALVNPFSTPVSVTFGAIGNAKTLYQSVSVGPDDGWAATFTATQASAMNAATKKAEVGTTFGAGFDFQFSWSSVAGQRVFASYEYFSSGFKDGIEGGTRFMTPWVTFEFDLGYWTATASSPSVKSILFRLAYPLN